MKSAILLLLDITWMIISSVFFSGSYFFIGVLVFFPLSILFVWFTLAPNNLWWTFVKEGTFKTIVRGGAFSKILIQWEGHKLDKEGTIIDKSALPHIFGGLRYYGFWPIKDIYLYDFEWTNVKGNGEIEHHFKETLDYGLLKDDLYYFKVESAEDIELLPMELDIIITARIINPYKALFAVQNWLEAVINRTKPAVRDAVTKKKYEKLIVDKNSVGEEIYKSLENRKLLKEEFLGKYGVEVSKVEVKEINPGKDYRDATLKKYLAEREKDKIVTEAEAEKQRIETVAAGEANRIERIYEKIKKYGDLGKFIRATEALEKSPGEGSKWVIPTDILNFFKDIKK